MISQDGAPRRLPWSTPEGKPCYVIGNGTGYVSRLADDIECAQLDMAAELLDHATDILADRRVTDVQLRYLSARMVEALGEVHRIAESRGARIPDPDAVQDSLEEGIPLQPEG